MSDSDQQITHEPGDVVNGHVFTIDNGWLPLASSEQVRKPWHKRIDGRVLSGIVGALLLVGIVAITGGGEDGSKSKSDSSGLFSSEPQTFDVSGSVHLVTADLYSDSAGCSGDGGYDDMQEGTQVVIYDNAGAMIGSGVLDRGVPDSAFPSVACDFAFTVPDVPVADTDLYSVEVSSRGKITFKQSEANTVSLSLGT